MIALYYYENLTLREIGEVLGVTESRVSQLHTKAVLRLRRLTKPDSVETGRRHPSGSPSIAWKAIARPGGDRARRVHHRELPPGR